jgi:hypothetical protein
MIPLKGTKQKKILGLRLFPSVLFVKNLEKNILSEKRRKKIIKTRFLEHKTQEKDCEIKKDI